MRSLFGLVLLIAGLGLGAYSYFPEAAEEHVRLVQLSRYVIPVAHDTAEADSESPLLTVSANSPLFGNSTHAAAPASDGQSTPVVLARQQLVRPSSNNDAFIPALSGAAPLAAPHPSPSVIAARAYDVQQELKRVGCYHGYLDGDWGPASRRAMQDFLTKVNASLPVDQPDDILLALLRSQPDGSCASDCPPGQVEGEGDRCVPSVVYANSAAGKRVDTTASVRQPRSPAESLSQNAIPASSTEEADEAAGLVDFTPAPGHRTALPGRMSIGGPLMSYGAPGKSKTQTSALPDLKPAPKGEPIETAAITPSEPVTKLDQHVSREPRKVAKKRHSSRKRYSQKVRQKRLMRQAFGEFF